MATNQDDDTDLLEQHAAAPVQPTVAGAPMVPGVVAPGNPMFPELEVRHKDGPDITSTTSKPALAPEQIDALKGHKDLLEGAKKIADETMEQSQATHYLEQLAREKVAAETARQEQAYLGVDDKALANIDAHAAHLRDAVQRYESMPLPSLFGDKTTGRQALMGLGLALGALGSAASAQANARLGGGGQAPDTVGEIIKNDLDRQRQNIKEMSDRVAMAKAGVDDAIQARKLLLADVDARGATAFKRIAAIAKANLGSQGLAQDAIDNHQAYLDAQKNYQESVDRTVAGLTQTHTTSAQQEADTTTTRSGQDKAPKDSLASLRRERIAANIEEYNKAAEELKKLGPDVITPEVLDRVQRNETALHAADQAHGITGVVGVVAGRAAEFVPKGKYDGLTDDQARAMQAIDTMLQHGSEMQPSTGVEVSEQWKGTNRPKPGTSQDVVNERLKHLIQAGQDYRAIIDPNRIGSRADAAAAGEPAPSFLAKPGAVSGNSVRNLTPSAVPQAVNPDDPNAANASRPLEEDAGAEELPPATKATPTTKTFQGKAGNHAPATMQPMKAPAASATPDIPRTLTPAKIKFIEQAKKEHFMPPPNVLKELGLTQEDFD